MANTGCEVPIGLVPGLLEAGVSHAGVLAAARMSDRTLQRLLEESGTSFRELLDDVRNEQARGYLGSTAYSDVEIAFLLGFEDPSSFYRAFRTWNGMSPAEYRKSTSPARGGRSREAVQ